MTCLCTDPIVFGHRCDGSQPERQSASVHSHCWDDDGRCHCCGELMPDDTEQLREWQKAAMRADHYHYYRKPQPKRPWWHNVLPW